MGWGEGWAAAEYNLRDPLIYLESILIGTGAAHRSKHAAARRQIILGLKGL